MHRLGSVDLSLVAIYLAGITLFGLQFRSKDRSLKNYFLADRRIPWWAIALSIVAAETSTLTIISVPGLAYTGDWGFLRSFSDISWAGSRYACSSCPAIFVGNC